MNRQLGKLCVGLDELGLATRTRMTWRHRQQLPFLKEDGGGRLACDSRHSSGTGWILTTLQLSPSRIRKRNTHSWAPPWWKRRRRSRLVLADGYIKSPANKHRAGPVQLKGDFGFNWMHQSDQNLSWPSCPFALPFYAHNRLAFEI